MSALFRRLGRWTLVFCALCAAFAAVAGGVRLLPWLLAPDVPLAVCVPFAKALGARALEAALVLGTPLAAATAAADFVRTGELRALASLGLSPARAAGSLAPLLLAVAALAVVLNLQLGADASRPGRFAAELLDHGRASCAATGAARTVTVPVVGVVWLCFPEATPRVAGPVPRSNARAWFNAADLEPAGDLTALAARDVVLALRPSAGRPDVTLRVDRAVMRGLPGWGVAPGGGWRSWWVGAALCSTALGLAWLVLRAGIESRLHALLLGGAAALILLELLHAQALAAFVAAPFAALASAGAIAVGAGVGARLAGLRGVFRRVRR